MTTLQYYSAKGVLTVFDEFTIDKTSVITNTKTRNVMFHHKNDDGYNIVNVRLDGEPKQIRVARAMASTFIGSPPTLHHTAEHKDGNRGNDTLNNIIWEDKRGQRKNQTRSSEYNTAYLIVNGKYELTANEWADVYSTPNGKRYAACTIAYFARDRKHGFRYKTFSNIRGEVWKAVPGSKSTKGEWFISNKNRMKYKTKHSENVLTVDQLTKSTGYPVVKINGKTRYCHYLSMETFRPKEYAAKLPGDIILHKNDNKLDFNPYRLRWGTPPENCKDAHKNGKHSGTKTAQKPVASYIDGVFEQKHESLSDAAKYLRKKGYLAVYGYAVGNALKSDVVCYDRTWKSIT
ncbi:hypothetical protein ATCVNTS1_840L [Acanthocystis turfacea Chlorella virus NTS-1]|nr:hypothetical protein ATCVNTS1_840L [Acanthocystis turfacea Chlorella virus NTS-1]